LRLARAVAGEVDPLVAAAGLARGEQVLDCTLGLGGDALLAAHATGAPVVGLEASPLLAAFTQVSLRRPGGAGPLLSAAREAGARVEVRCAEHGAALAALPSGSFDVVLFDPMFRLPSRASPLFGLVRALASEAPLTREVLREAQRVARRGVLVKDAAPGRELGRLGMAPLPSRRFPRIVFGWCDAL
jgi:predicted methyltransferase